MTTAGKIGLGVTFKIGDAASPEVFTAVAEILGIDGPGMSRDSVDMSSADSASFWREFLPGMKDGGEVSFELILIPANLTALNAELAKNVNTNYQITWPFSPVKTWDFAGHMTGFEVTAPFDDKISGTATFKVSGQPTLT